MSHGNKFTESQLRQLGFHPDAEGCWSKDSIPSHAPRPQIADVEPDANRKLEIKAAKKSRREEGFPRGVRFILIVHSYRTRLIDPSNACFKALEDCLVKNGVFPDDSPEFCDPPIFLQSMVKEGNEKTEIEVLAYA